VTFKQRVHKELIAGAAIYKAVFDEVIQGDIELFCAVHPGLFAPT
jgi:hypothetical protein